MTFIGYITKSDEIILSVMFSRWDYNYMKNRISGKSFVKKIIEPFEAEDIAHAKDIVVENKKIFDK